MHPSRITWYPAAFASDNNSGVHPAIISALIDVNCGHAIAYGDDPCTCQAEKTLQKHFGDDAAVFFVLNGTGANVSALSSVTRPYHAIFCAESAHINVDECGAPEHLTGCKLIDLPSPDGKISITSIEPYLESRGDEHQVQPGIISLTQATERGTVYRPHEILAITRFAHENGMLVHMDGARLCNAAAFLGCTLREITTDAGVDLLSFGGTKNGIMYGEAVLFLNGAPPGGFQYCRKQTTQLASKMRYISAQFDRLLRDDLWYLNASQANQMARLLSALVSDIEGVSIMHPVESNAVFVSLPHQAVEKMLEETFFYVIDSKAPVVRWMTSFDTTEEQVREFAALVKKVVTW
ncbi:MAG TPA: low specificity L-threonine aldolase [Methanospirillum sp.]|nr:low specificity L-threonine aldolase [Methanospirillum sp.]